MLSEYDDIEKKMYTDVYSVIFLLFKLGVVKERHEEVFCGVNSYGPVVEYGERVLLASCAWEEENDSE